MRLRKTSDESGVSLQMTPLIDIVFQLLIFFVMSFRVAQMEGDLAIAMPRAAAVAQSEEMLVPAAPIPVRLIARENGSLARIDWGERPLAGVAQLHAQAEALVSQMQAAGEDTAPLSVDLYCDPRLQYDHSIAALTALRGERLAAGEIRPLIPAVRLCELPAAQ